MPVLLIDGLALTEVAGILICLGRAFPEAKLLPIGAPETEAQMVSWMSYIDSTIHPAWREGLEAAREVYKVADKRLGTGGWITGQYSIADIHLFRLFWRFRSLLEPAPGEFANIEAHYDRMMAQPAVKKSIEIEERIGYALPR